MQPGAACISEMDKFDCSEAVLPAEVRLQQSWRPSDALGSRGGARSGSGPPSADQAGPYDFMSSSYLGTPERSTMMIPLAGSRSAHQRRSPWGMRRSLDGSRSMASLFDSKAAPVGPDARKAIMLWTRPACGRGWATELVSDAAGVLPVPDQGGRKGDEPHAAGKSGRNMQQARPAPRDGPPEPANRRRQATRPEGSHIRQPEPEGIWTEPSPRPLRISQCATRLPLASPPAVPDRRHRHARPSAGTRPPSAHSSTTAIRQTEDCAASSYRRRSRLALMGWNAIPTWASQ